jgi:hypothetical protein
MTDLIMKVHELRTVTAEIAVPEKEIADVRLGVDVLLKARAFPGVALHGRVTAIAPIEGTPAGPGDRGHAAAGMGFDPRPALRRPEAWTEQPTHHGASCFTGEHFAEEEMPRVLMPH